MKVFAPDYRRQHARGIRQMGIAFMAKASLSQPWLKRVVSFAAGSMLALALLDLLPEALEQRLATDDWVALLLVALDVKLHAGCRHGADEACAHDLARPMPFVLVGGALHVLIDGLMLGAACLADPMRFKAIRHVCVAIAPRRVHLGWS